MEKGYTRIIFMLLIAALAQPGSALRDPAYVYCTDMGYTYVIEDRGAGERAYCKIFDDLTVDAWDFLQGKIGRENSYCAKQGHEIKTVKDKERCAIFGREECAVCVTEEGEIEVTNLMNLTFEETSCGDGICGVPEDSQTCPEDCPKGGFDSYCDGGDDPDCEKPLTEAEIIELAKSYSTTIRGEVKGVEPPQKDKSEYPLIGGAIVIFAAVIYFTLRRSKGKHEQGKT